MPDVGEDLGGLEAWAVLGEDRMEESWRWVIRWIESLGRRCEAPLNHCRIDQVLKDTQVRLTRVTAEVPIFTLLILVSTSRGEQSRCHLPR
jgi:hypothetical protein